MDGLQRADDGNGRVAAEQNAAMSLFDCIIFSDFYSKEHYSEEL